MVSFSSTLQMARQLKGICSQPGSVTPSSPHAMTSAYIPPFHSSASSDLPFKLQSLGLTTSPIDGLGHLYAQHLHSHRQCVEAEYLHTAHRLVETMQYPPELAATLQTNIDLLLRTYQSRYESLSRQMETALLRDVAARLARQRGCQPDRPVQLGKSFSKVCRSPFLSSSSLFVADLPFDPPLHPLLPEIRHRPPPNLRPKLLPQPGRAPRDRLPCPYGLQAVSSLGSSFFPSCSLPPLFRQRHCPVAFPTARGLPSLTPG
jgi:hypothetical protein